MCVVDRLLVLAASLYVSNSLYFVPCPLLVRVSLNRLCFKAGLWSRSRESGVRSRRFFPGVGVGVGVENFHYPGVGVGVGVENCHSPGVGVGVGVGDIFVLFRLLWQHYVNYQYVTFNF